eukprot:4134603-Prymnesium_polylepis.1
MQISQLPDMLSRASALLSTSRRARVERREQAHGGLACPAWSCEIGVAGGRRARREIGRVPREPPRRAAQVLLGAVVLGARRKLEHLLRLGRRMRPGGAVGREGRRRLGRRGEHAAAT